LKWLLTERVLTEYCAIFQFSQEIAIGLQLGSLLSRLKKQALPAEGCRLKRNIEISYDQVNVSQMRLREEQQSSCSSMRGVLPPLHVQDYQVQHLSLPFADEWSQDYLMPLFAFSLRPSL